MDESDITPCRMTPVDVVFLSSVEVRAILVHLCGHADPVVRDALMEATQQVVTRTRGEG